jgi:hypothetical protein
MFPPSHGALSVGLRLLPTCLLTLKCQHESTGPPSPRFASAAYSHDSGTPGRFSQGFATKPRPKALDGFCPLQTMTKREPSSSRSSPLKLVALKARRLGGSRRVGLVGPGDRRCGPSAWERQREWRRAAESAARAAPWGRLEDVKKVLTAGAGQACPTPTDG